jgi:hypothetical protein
MSVPDETGKQSNRRTSLRMGVSDPDECVVLCYGYNRSPVRVIDVSTGGFGVEAGSDVTFLLDQQIQLETDNWLHDVRVIYVNKGDGVNRIGLERLSDKPLGSARAFMRKVHNSPNLGKLLLNSVRGIGRVFNPEQWQGSASFFATLAICFLVLMSAYLVKNGVLGGNRNSWKNSSAMRAVNAPRNSSRTSFSTSPTTYEPWETGRSPNSLGKRLRISWLDLRMIFKPGDILYEGITRTVIYNDAPPKPSGGPGVMSSFDQKLQASWNQLKEQIRSADKFLRIQQADNGPKTEAGTTGDPSATTTGSNPNSPDGTVDGTPGGSVQGTSSGRQRNNRSPTLTTPSKGTGPSGNSGTSTSTSRNGSATP